MFSILLYSSYNLLHMVMNHNVGGFPIAHVLIIVRLVIRFIWTEKQSPLN